MSEQEICDECGLFTSGIRKVVGEGPLSPKLMIIGDAPGFSENDSGRPHVGAGGRLLRKALNEAGWVVARDIFFMNLVRCMPRNPDDKYRRPEKHEYECCWNLQEAIMFKHIAPAILLVGTGPWIRIGEFFSQVPFEDRPALHYLENPGVILRQEGVPEETTQYKSMVLFLQSIREEL